MSEEDVIAAMVKGRECCRQLIKAYERVHTGEDAGNSGAADIEMLTTADRTVTRMMACLGDIPAGVAGGIADESRRQYVARLLKEMGLLLERLMVLEREVRVAAMSQTSRVRSVRPGARALQAYANA